MAIKVVVLFMAILVFVALGSPIERSDDPYPLEAVVQNLASQVSALQAKLTAVENSVHHLQARENQRVAFTASIPESSVKAAPGHIIPFSHVITNVGSAYDPNTSAFTAPYDGQYMIFVSIDVSADYRRLYIARNGRSIIVGHNDVDDHHIYAGGAITLTAGDEVTVKQGVNVVGILDGGEEAVFSGFKI